MTALLRYFARRRRHEQSVPSRDNMAIFIHLCEKDPLWRGPQYEHTFTFPAAGGRYHLAGAAVYTRNQRVAHPCLCE